MRSSARRFHAGLLVGAAALAALALYMTFTISRGPGGEAVTLATATPTATATPGFASVSGVVTANGTPVAGAEVEVYSVACCSLNSAFTDGAGAYTVTGFTGGCYKVQAVKAGFATRVYNGQYSLNAANPVCVADGATANGINFALVPGGQISGTVTNALGTPISGAQVTAEEFSNPPFGSFQGSDITDGSGAYQIGDVPPVNLRVRATASGFVDRYYQDSPTYGGATPLLVPLGATTDVDFALTAGATVSGLITDELGTPVANAQVYAWCDNCDGSGSDQTGLSGTFSINALLPGDYRVIADANGFVYEYYNDKFTFDGADLVPLSDGVTTSGINFELGHGGSISGTITDALGTPIAGANVYADAVVCCSSADPVVSDGNGDYTIENMAPGEHFVSAQAGGYATEFFGGAYSRDAATHVVVSDGLTTPNIDIALDVGGSISGTVRDGNGDPVSGASIDAICTACDTGAGASSDFDGTYQIADLAPGKYTVRASRFPDLSIEYYNNVFDPAFATLVDVDSGLDSGGIDFDLDPPGAISGVVVDVFGDPLAGVSVSANCRNCDGYGEALTLGDGSYTMTGVTPGAYTVSANVPGLPMQYFNAEYDSLAADPVVVASAATTNGINFTLVPGGTIAGKVTAQGGAPIANALVSARRLGTLFTAHAAVSGGDGTYEIPGVAPGNYIIEASAAGRAQEFFNDAYTTAGATVLEVGPGDGLKSVNFELAVGGAVAGTVTDSLATPIAGAVVEIARIPCCYTAQDATDGAGAFALLNVPAGNYRVRFSKTGYASEFHNNAFSPTTATLVTVTDGVSSPVSAQLAAAGSISGTVTNGAGAPIPWAWVVASFDGSNAVTGSATAGPDGAYTIGGLPAGNYRVFADRAGYTREMYDNVYTTTAATLIGVTSGVDTPGKNFSLGVVTPDFSTGPVIIPGLPYADNRSTAGMTVETGEPSPCGSIGATAWYALAVPPGVQSLSISATTAGSGFDTVLAVYTGNNIVSPPGAFGLLGCNDNGTGQAAMSFTGTPGQTYYLQIGGASGATGSLQLNVSCVDDGDCDGLVSAGDNCGGAFNPVQLNTDGTNTAIGFPGTDATGNACDADDDGDGCVDLEELLADPNFGGQRNPVDAWDVYDVTDDARVDLSDTLVILAHFGHGPNDDPLDNRLDRHAPIALKPWRTDEAPGTEGVDLSDALVSLDSFGHDCSGAP